MSGYVKYAYLALVAALPAAAPASAADIQGHAIGYLVSVEKPPADLGFEAQVSATLTKTCEGWGYGAALYYSIDRTTKGGKRDPKAAMSDRSDIYNERIKFSEALDGLSMAYEASYRAVSASEQTRGTILFGGATAPGTLDMKSDKIARKVPVPAGALPPVALRAALIDQLAALQPLPPGAPAPSWKVTTVEIGRFHTPIDATFELVPAAAVPAKPPPPPPRGAVVVAPPPKLDSPLLKTPSWTLKMTSKGVGEWVEST
ncbi:MAG: hypothetical protein JNL07_10125, partial [Rhodospirillales bacterium]|nr:hypothetical protein [Rhodospirillales bacterium]